MTIDRKDEEQVSKAVVIIRQAVERFEEKYAVSDKQDALAMTALQMANQMLSKTNDDSSKDSDVVLDRLRTMESQLDAVLSSNIKN